MSKTILLLGRKGIVVEDAKALINDPNIEIYGGTCIEDVRSTFDKNKIDHVFMGAGIEIEKRLEIVREIYHLSSGPHGLLPFVKALLIGLNAMVL